MPRPCSICSHPERDAIDRALLGSTSLRDIAAQFTVTSSSLQRHKPHIPEAMVLAKDAETMARGDDLLAEVRRLQKTTYEILSSAKSSGDNRTALTAIREARGNLELLGRLLGELQEQTVTVNALILSPEWTSVRTAILRALEAFPEAQGAVIVALEAHNAGH